VTLNADLLQNGVCLRQATRVVEEVMHASFFDLLFYAGFGVRQ
jgi:hypothetical protein